MLIPLIPTSKSGHPAPVSCKCWTLHPILRSATTMAFWLASTRLGICLISINFDYTSFNHPAPCAHHSAAHVPFLVLQHSRPCVIGWLIYCPMASMATIASTDIIRFTGAALGFIRQVTEYCSPCVKITHSNYAQRAFLHFCAVTYFIAADGFHSCRSIPHASGVE